MFCNQCEQTTRGDVCHQWGACGKSPEVDALQDLLVHCLRGLSQVALQAKSLWYEQKAIAVLLTLLHLGIQNIRIGPTLPAFLSANVIKLLSETYHLQLITTPEQDLAACLG